MPFCAQCGTSLDHADRFCQSCGTPSTTAPNQALGTAHPLPTAQMPMPGTPVAAGNVSVPDGTVVMAGAGIALLGYFMPYASAPFIGNMTLSQIANLVHTPGSFDRGMSLSESLLSMAWSLPILALLSVGLGFAHNSGGGRSMILSSLLCSGFAAFFSILLLVSTSDSGISHSVGAYLLVAGFGVATLVSARGVIASAPRR